MSSLGFLWAFDQLSRPGVAGCERYFRDPAVYRRGRSPLSLESGRPLAACDVVAVSISYELDFVHLVQMLHDGGIPSLAGKRSDHHPLVIAGGPLCRANPELLAPIADVVVCGDGEAGLECLMEQLARRDADRRSIIDSLAAAPGVVGDQAPQAYAAPASALPVVSTMFTPHSSLPGLLLAEVSRGCPRECTFCLGRRPNAPLRLAPADLVLERIPDQAPGLGIIGAAVGFHPALKELLRFAVDRGMGAGVSSLRAERVDEELAQLLRATGSRVLTVAADGASRRVRRAIRKEVAEAHLVQCAELARKSGFHALKVYVMVGLPEETEEDIREFVGLANQLHRVVPVVLSPAVFVPKKNTPLALASFGPVSRINNHLRLLQRECSAGIRMGRVSAREAAVHHLLARASRDDAPGLVDAALAGGRYRDFKAHGPTMAFD